MIRRKAAHERPNASPQADRRDPMELNEANRLLDAGHLDRETGVERLPSGQLLVAALTPMPQATGAMLDHWFETLTSTERYKLWHPIDHVWMDWDGKPGAVGSSHLVHEYIGGELQKLRIHFREPSTMLDVSRFDAAGIAFCKVIRVGPLEAEGVWTGHGIHLARETCYGLELRSRFWLGDLEPEPLPREALEAVLPESTGFALLKHCSEEMSYLADLLPELYEAETRGAS
jgi:hypothetical protein